MIVLDTSALLFWTLDPGNLSNNARKAIEEADRVLVSSISIWEIGFKVKNQELGLPLSVSDYVDRLRRMESLEILPVDGGTWLDNLELAWDQGDPADRTIVALATRFECPLVTSDPVIADFYSETIW